MPGEFNWDKIIETHEANGLVPPVAAEEQAKSADELTDILDMIPDRIGSAGSPVPVEPSAGLVPPPVPPVVSASDETPQIPAPEVESWVQSLSEETDLPSPTSVPSFDMEDAGVEEVLKLVEAVDAVEPDSEIPSPSSVPSFDIEEEPVALEHDVPMPATPIPTGIELPTRPSVMDEPDLVIPAPTPGNDGAEAEPTEEFELPKPPTAIRPDFLNHLASPYEQLPADSAARKLSDERMKDLPTPRKHVSAPPIVMPGPAVSSSTGAPNQHTVQAIYSAAESDKFDMFSEPSNELMSDGYAASLDGLHLDDVLRLAVERRASDVHFTAGLPPMARIDGEVQSLPYMMCKPGDTRRMLMDILNDDQIQKFEKTHELDLSYSIRDAGRFRVNIYMQRGAVAAAIRAIPGRIPSFEELNLPPVLREISQRTSGLILVTGPTGSGKSTSIAAMIDDINNNRNGHIMTIEDPIEYLHKHKKCMVNQREMHSDTYSFHNALRAVLREDPDIILVGELRDLETIEAALTLAETGHLVFGTLHTRNAPATIDRLVDVFPAEQQEQIRVLLGNTLEGVISQQLLPKIGGGRIAALEVMTGVPSVRNLIREGKTHQLYSVIETGKQNGMFTMDGSLASLFRSGIVSYEECMLRAVDKESFARLAKAAA